MELLIAGAVLFVGYRMTDSRGGEREPRERPSYARLPGGGGEIDEADTFTTEADRDMQRRARDAMAASRDPGATGMVTSSTLTASGPVPFFRSARTQNSNDGMKQRRMEMFTGADSADTSQTGTFRKKREVHAMFEPGFTAQTVTSAGSAGNASVARDRGRLEPGVMRTNELPTEQIRVGPGVGVGPDVLATDGLHPMYRVMPCNVNAYRRNNLPGGVVSGAHHVSKGPSSGKFQARPRTDSTSCHNARDSLPTAGATTAHRVYPRIAMKAKPQDLTVEDRMGNPGMQGPHAGAGCGVLAHTRKAKRQLDAKLPWLNLAGPEGAGAFTHSRMDMRPQRREADGRLGIASGPEGLRVAGAEIARHTQRESTAAMPWGGIGVVRSTGAVRVAEAKPTLREDMGAPPLLGAVAAVKGGSMNNVYRDERPLRFTKRSVQHIGSGFYEGRAPQASRINRVRPDDLGAVGIRRQDRENARPGAPSAPGRQSLHVGASTGPHNKLPTLNPRMDSLALARDQLLDNPFALESVWDQANGIDVGRALGATWA